MRFGTSFYMLPRKIPNKFDYSYKLAKIKIYNNQKIKQNIIIEYYL